MADAFRHSRPVFLTVTAGPSGAAIYANGVLARRAPRFPLSAADFSGGLILGDSPAQPDNWSGTVLGLALYQRELAPAEVRRHYQNWPPRATEDRNIALYLFDERAGPVAHDRSGSGFDLVIPDRYQVVDKLFLEPFWSEFSFSRSYWDSVVKNIIGFLPFGFCFYLCLLLHKVRNPVLLTLIVGFLISLTIEVLQAYLPTRDSGTTDLITNTLGTGIGMMASRMLLKYSRIRIEVP